MEANGGKVHKIEGIPSVEDGLINCAKEAVTAFLILYKVYSLYPKDNELCEKSLVNAMNKLERCFSFSENIRFQVSKYSFHMDEHPIYNGPEEEGNLCFVLFREGIKWIEFQSGISMHDIHRLFRIITSEGARLKAEGDIVTGLWEAQIPNFNYHASDELLLSEIEDDWSKNAIFEAIVSYCDGESEMGISDEGEKEKVRLISSDIDDEGRLFKLEEEDKKYLISLIQKEMTRNPSDEALLVLIEALREERLQEEFETIISFLGEMYLDSLIRMDFKRSIDLLEKIRYIETLCRNEKTWALPLVESFYVMASGPEAFKLIEENLPLIEEEDLLNILKLLSFKEERIESLFRILLKTESPKLRDALIRILVELGRRDISPFLSLLKENHSKPPMLLIFILERIGTIEAYRALEGLLKSPDRDVKRSALIALMGKEVLYLKKAFQFIEDEDMEVRKAVFDCLGKKRSQVGEDLLMAYINNKDFLKKEPHQILEAFKALGLCGSSRSIPFLRNLL
ncbi:MAG: hypothetical protein QXH17_09785, partial [Candidatus Bathyarchaeia archaeon]